MAHLSDEQLILVARDQATSEAREHAVECSRCAGAVDMWKLALETLPPVLSEEVSDSEMHHIQTLYRHHGPERKSVVQWIASLVRSSNDQVAASMRGGAMADLFEYEAGPFTVMFESGPMLEGAFPVHGQVFHCDGGALKNARVVFASDDGTAFVENIDEFGEFHLEVTVPGRYSATVWTDEGTFRVEDLDVGRPEGG